jgi:hypothetical protein
MKSCDAQNYTALCPYLERETGTVFRQWRDFTKIPFAIMPTLNFSPMKYCELKVSWLKRQENNKKWVLDKNMDTGADPCLTFVWSCAWRRILLSVCKQTRNCDRNKMPVIQIVGVYYLLCLCSTASAVIIQTYLSFLLSTCRPPIVFELIIAAME